MDFWEYSLRSLLNADIQNYSEEHIEVLVYNLLCSVKYLHSVGVLHRDIKPSNIMVTPECTVRICDFGLSRSFEENIDPTNADNEPIDMSPTAFSRWYRPPEVILLQKYDKKGDLWSIGCVIAELALKVVHSSDPKKCILFPGKSCYPISPCAAIE